MLPIESNSEISAEQAVEISKRAKDNDFLGRFVEEESLLACDIEDIMDEIMNRIFEASLTLKTNINIVFSIAFEDTPPTRRNIVLHLAYNHLEKLGYEVRIAPQQTLYINWSKVKAPEPIIRDEEFRVAHEEVKKELGA